MSEIVFTMSVWKEFIVLSQPGISKIVSTNTNGMGNTVNVGRWSYGSPVPRRVREGAEHPLKFPAHPLRFDLVVKKLFIIVFAPSRKFRNFLTPILC